MQAVEKATRERVQLVWIAFDYQEVRINYRKIKIFGRSRLTAMHLT